MFSGTVDLTVPKDGKINFAGYCGIKSVKKKVIMFALLYIYAVIFFIYAWIISKQYVMTSKYMEKLSKKRKEKTSFETCKVIWNRYE